MKKIKPLNDEERKLYDQVNDDVTKSKDGFWTLVRAMGIAKHMRLYREEYDSFQDWAWKKHGLGKSYAYQLASAHGVMEDIKSLPEAKIVTNVSQASALADVPSEQRPAVITKAAESGPVTAESIRVAAEVIAKGEPEKTPEPPKPAEPPKPKPHTLDDMGTIVPLSMMHFWDRRKEVEKFMKQLSDMKCHIEKCHETGDPLYERHYAAAVTELAGIRRRLVDCMPEVVCGLCQGKPKLQPTGCAMCHDTGFQSKARYLANTKAINVRAREMAIKQRIEKEGR